MRDDWVHQIKILFIVFRILPRPGLSVRRFIPLKPPSAAIILPTRFFQLFPCLVFGIPLLSADGFVAGIC